MNIELIKLLKPINMHTLPYSSQHDLFPHLAAWFRFRLNTNGLKQLDLLLKESGSMIANAFSATESDYSPLTPAENERWKVLDRKAKQENLSGSDSAEYNILLEVQVYNRFKEAHPHLPHQVLVSMVKNAL